MIAMNASVTPSPHRFGESAHKLKHSKRSFRSSTHTSVTDNTTLDGSGASSQGYSMCDDIIIDTNRSQVLVKSIAQELLRNLRDAKTDKEKMVLASLKKLSMADIRLTKSFSDFNYSYNQEELPKDEDNLIKTGMSGTAETAASRSCQDVSSAAGQMSETVTKASSERKTQRRSSTGTGISQISLVVQKPAPMDIWHPEFWNKKDDTTDNMDKSQSIKVDLEEVFNNHQNNQPDVAEDEVSVMSDISGLTEYFPDFAAERKAKPANAKSTTVLNKALSSVKCFNHSKGKKRKVSVSFGDVQVRLYKQTISTHPECTRGPGLGIDWEYVPQDTIAVDEWEFNRRRLRLTNELLMSRAFREQILRDWGYQEQDFACAIREINRIKANRRQTVTNLGLQRMEEAMEGARKKVVGALLLRKKVATGF
jgi:hypothetical protein